MALSPPSPVKPAFRKATTEATVIASAGVKKSGSAIIVPQPERRARRRGGTGQKRVPPEKRKFCVWSPAAFDRTKE
jgi:hypothetical protein